MRSLVTILIGLIGAHVCSCMSILPDPDNPSGYIVYRQELEAHESEITSDPIYASWSKALETRPNSLVELIAPGNADNPANVKLAESVFTQTDWDFLTSYAANEYSYVLFLRAIGKFPAFCGAYTDGRDAAAICIKSIVLSFAHYAQETGAHTPDVEIPEWRQALHYVREIGFNEGDKGYDTGCGVDDWKNAKWPCSDVGYFGRGAKQLSYHYNYGPFSEAMYSDATVLLSKPRDVAETWLNIASSIWFFLTPQPPKPAMLHVIDRTWAPSTREVAGGIGYGFGTTINIINGGLECGAGNENNQQAINRVMYWQELIAHFNIHLQSDEINTCFQQTPYSNINLEGATDVPFVAWDRDWGYYPDRPGNYPFECKLVHYQTAYSALVKSDYELCVADVYKTHGDWPQTRVVDIPGFVPSTTPDPYGTTPNTAFSTNNHIRIILFAVLAFVQL